MEKYSDLAPEYVSLLAAIVHIIRNIPPFNFTSNEKMFKFAETVVRNRTQKHYYTTTLLNGNILKLEFVWSAFDSLSLNTIVKGQKKTSVKKWRIRLGTGVEDSSMYLPYAKQIVDYIKGIDDSSTTPDDSQCLSNEFKYSYNEDVLWNEIKCYIDDTYRQHYAKGKYQATDMIFEAGYGEGFVIGNALKYLWRYGKKDGYNEKDLFKAIHYIIMALHLKRKQEELND